MAKARQLLGEMLRGNASIKINIFRGDTEIPVEVDLDTTAPSRGSRERGTGLALEPDDPGSVDVVGAFHDLTGEELILTPEEEQRAVETFLNQEPDVDVPDPGPSDWP